MIASDISQQDILKISRNSFPLDDSPQKTDYSRILDAIGDSYIVLIGEASHGTHQFYSHRAQITKELIEGKGFNAVVAEADWPDAYRVHRYVMDQKVSRDSSVEEALGDFKRFPQWMWRNTVTLEFFNWLKNLNQSREKNKVGFYGMDLYSFFSSMQEVINYLEKVSPEDADIARELYGKFDQYQGNESAYGIAIAHGFDEALEKECVRVLVNLQQKGPEYLKGLGGFINGDELFYAKQNAELVKNAERYYREMFKAGSRTWNLRDQHMAECVRNLKHHFEQKGIIPKIVIWAHNSHIGDARFTDAGERRGEWNIGQLMREIYGMQNVFNIGFSTYKGSVTASSAWGEQFNLIKVRNGLVGSFEHLFYTASTYCYPNYGLVFRSNYQKIQVDQELVELLSKKRWERYIGVIYRPDTEKASHYSKSEIAREFDAVLFLSSTYGLEPLDSVKRWKSQKRRFSESIEALPELDTFMSPKQKKQMEESCIKAVEEMLLLIDKQSQIGNYSIARELCIKALNYISQFTEREEAILLQLTILIKKSECAVQLDLWNEALEDAQKVLDTNPKHIEALLIASAALIEKGNYEKATKFLDKAKVIDPKHSKIEKLKEKLKEAIEGEYGFFKKGFLNV